MIKSCLRLFVFVLVMQGCNNTDGDNQSLTTVVPQGHSVDLSNQRIQLPKTLVYSAKNNEQEALADFVQTHLNRLFPKNNTTRTAENIPLSFLSNEKLAKEAYVLDIQKDAIVIEASDHFGFIRAASTLLQLPDENGLLPIGKIEDAPDYDYRALMIDCSRSWYSVATIKQIIDLCFWYKIKYLHLHLTDDGLFTFPSSAFPKLASDQSYSIAELKELNEYAYQRGCILIPEIDMPGHSSVFVDKYPEVFGLENINDNYWTINMGKESAYTALETILREVSEAFPHAPYIHLGGDEVNTRGMKDDPDTRAYMDKNDLESLDDLYHHFLTRVTRMVIDLGRTPIIWSDFTNEGTVKIPNDVVIMVWKTGAYHPDQLVKDGFKIINASWQPLYVVNNRKWTPKEIYDWGPTIWKASQTTNKIRGISMDTHQNLMGASMEVWEQNEYKAIISLRHRLPAMSENLWNSDFDNYDNFEARMEKVDKRLGNFLYGFRLQEKGLTYPEWKDSNFDEHMWFADSLVISAAKLQNNISLGYHYFSHDNQKRELVDIEDLKMIDSTLVVKKGGPMVMQAYDKNSNKPTGHPIYKNYALRPIQVQTTGLIDTFLPHNWEHHKFVDSLKIAFNTTKEGDIYYTIDGRTPSQQSIKYDGAFYLRESARVQAQLFSAITGNNIGRSFYQQYLSVVEEESLTTGKPIYTSNGDDELGNTAVINDGSIALEDYWGDHTDGDNWVIIDLEENKEIQYFKTYTYWDGSRFYEYNIEVSDDNINWKMVVDRSMNRTISSQEGITDSLDTPVSARYLKLSLIRNSANPGLHLIEFNAF